MTSALDKPVFTIGHSTHPIEHFLELLRCHTVTAVADVRSLPYSRRVPQYNREPLRRVLEQAGIKYVFLGRELGGRTDDSQCYEGGKIRYDRLASTAAFRSGLQRVRDGSERFRLALMCAERDPLDCHRAILIAKHLTAEGLKINHIHGDGRLEEHGEAIARLIAMLKMSQMDMFQSPEDVAENVYKEQEARIAFSLDSADDLPKRATGRPNAAA